MRQGWWFHVAAWCGLGSEVEVIRDSDSGWGFVDWYVLSQKFPVAEGHPARAVYAHDVLVILADFNDNTCLVPLGGVIACLVLNTYVITNFKRGELSCVFVPTFSELHVPVPEGFLTSG